MAKKIRIKDEFYWFEDVDKKNWDWDVLGLRHIEHKIKQKQDNYFNDEDVQFLLFSSSFVSR